VPRTNSSNAKRTLRSMLAGADMKFGSFVCEKQRSIMGRSYPRREAPPAQEHWGTYGWTYTAASHVDPLRWAKARMRACLEHPGKCIVSSELRKF
jgi:hypothetical protein